MNIFLIFVTLLVSKFLTFKFVKDEHPLNIFSIFSEFDVPKLDKSKVIKLEQSQNIFLIFVTNWFLKLLLFKPEIEFNFEQPINIFSIDIAWLVSKLFKSRLSKEEQLEKIFSILWAFWVLKLLLKIIFSTEEQLLNKFSI